MLIRSRRAALACVSLALLAPAAAWAHAILESSDPPDGGTVTAGTVTLTFRFNSRIDRARSRLTLTRPDRSRETLTIDPDGPPERVAARVTLSPGAYVVRWQVLAVDGHITRGDVRFQAAGR